MVFQGWSITALLSFFMHLKELTLAFHAQDPFQPVFTWSGGSGMPYQFLWDAERQAHVRIYSEDPGPCEFPFSALESDLPDIQSSSDLNIWGGVRLTLLDADGFAARAEARKQQKALDDQARIDHQEELARLERDAQAAEDAFYSAQEKGPVKVTAKQKRPAVVATPQGGAPSGIAALEASLG